jgi:hypothetical protein
LILIFTDNLYSTKKSVMRKIILSAALFFFYCFVSAQAYTVTAEYQKSMQPGLEIEIPYPEKTVSSSLIEKLEKKGYKAKESKGYIIFKGVNLPEIGQGEYDLYFKVDRKSRQQKDASVVTLLISSGQEKFISESDNPEVFGNAKKMLNEHIAVSAAVDLELQIKEQQEVNRKADKKLADLIDDSTSLQKKKIRLEEDIVENSKKRELQRAEIEKQKQIFEKLAARRKQ